MIKLIPKVLLALVLTISCNNINQDKDFDLKWYSIKLGDSWRLLKKYGIDSSYGLLINDKDTVKYYMSLLDEPRIDEVIFILHDTDKTDAETLNQIRNEGIDIFRSSNPDSSFKSREFHSLDLMKIEIDEKKAIVYTKKDGQPWSLQITDVVDKKDLVFEFEKSNRDASLEVLNAIKNGSFKTSKDG